MAIAFDAASTINGVASPATVAHTCGTGATALFVFTRNDSGMCSGVTYNGVALTQINALTSTANYQLWRLLAPAVGTNNLVVTAAAGVTFAAAASYTGTTTSGIDANNTATTAGIAVTTVANNCWQILGAGDRTGTSPTAVTNCTRRATPSAAASIGIFDSNAPKTPAGSITLTSSVSGTIGSLIASIAPGAGAALATSAAFAIATTAALLTTPTLAAATTFGLSTSVTLTTPGPLLATPTITIGTTANLTAPIRFRATATISVATAAVMVVPPNAAATAAFRVATTATLSTGVEAVHATRVSVRLAGVEARVRVSGLTIRDIINDAPNTASLTIDGSETPVGEQSLRITINADAPRLLFAGALQTVDLSYEGKPAQRVYPCTAIDDTDRAKRRQPFGTWTTVSATTIGQYLATVAGMSSAGIALGLPAVSMNLDGSEGFNGGMDQLATLSGCDWKVEDGVVYLFTEDTTDAPDDIDDTPGRFLDDPPIRVVTDDSQLRTRSFGKGHGEQVLSDVAAGESIVPVSNAAAWFGTVTPGGKAISDTQVLAYTGVRLGGGGSLVGPGGGPSGAPALGLVPGAGLGTGVYGYAYTDVTPSGESLPSPLGSITTRASLSPPSAPTFIQSFAGTTLSGTYKYAVTFLTAAGETLPSSLLTLTTGSVSALQISLPLGGAGVIGRRLYRTVQAGSQLKLTYTSPDNTAVAYNDGTPDGSLGANAPTVDSTGGNQVAVSGIAVGSGATTSRKVYRTAVDGAQLKLLATIANNSATTIATDTLADGSLGANAPTSDLSGLSFVAGQVNAGSTALLTASAGPFSPTGGWVLLPNGQAVRYTGISGNTLTGVPASGVGAILTTVLYGQQVVPAPALTGVTGIVVPLLNGAPVNIWVQRDDLAAQAEQAVIDLANGRVPADGIYEAPPIVDERRGEASLILLCDATLAQFSRPLQTVTYACIPPSDRPFPKSGKTQHFDLTTPPIGPVDLVLSEVTIDQIDVSPGVMPRFTVTAGPRFTLDQLIRKLVP